MSAFFVAHSSSRKPVGSNSIAASIGLEAAKHLDMHENFYLKQVLLAGQTIGASLSHLQFCRFLIPA
jgi:Holliday junction resolvasome RuvABC ATP-dependent DNA helicase subunit